MRRKEDQQKDSAEKAVREIRRATRRRFSAEEKIRVVLEGLRGEDSISELCRREKINQNLYYRVKHRPRLLSDNGPSYISGELADWLEGQGIIHTRGRPYHPMTQGKIERWHRSMKNQILLENYYLPGQLQSAIDSFVAYYNHERFHESLKNLTPADVSGGLG